jgi:putative transposase
MEKLGLGLQISRGLHPRVSKTNAVQAATRTSGRGVQEVGRAKECRIEEGHLIPDHVHMMLSVPPKHSVSLMVGFVKGKSATHLARVYGERKRNFVGKRTGTHLDWVRS